MNGEAKFWTLDGFVEHFAFVHDTMGEHKYAWVLGAGASKASGIPLGSELVDQWLEELFVRECKDKVNIKEAKDWATADNLGKDRFRQFKWDERASFYPQIFQRRFSEYPPEGYAYLENVMSGKDPSPGYSILAAALSGQVARSHHAPPHNVVITTNFDNLVSDALSIYTDTFPLICGHESLAGFAGVSLTRPLICKIHRDLLFTPQNDPRSLKRLKDAWGLALTKLFEHYTPIFIGYGGNDDTLMDLLESLDTGSIKGQIVWTFYEKSQPSERIRNVVAEHNGVLVPVPDFDLLMILLGEKMKIGLLDEKIESRSRERVSRYRNRVESLDVLKSQSVLDAFAAMTRRSEGWWAWDRRARAENDPVRTEQIYREGIKHFPKSAPLHGNYANFLTRNRKYDDAQPFYQLALKIDPKDASTAANITANYAVFLWSVRGKHNEAETLYQQALHLDSKSAFARGSYANFLSTVHGKHDEAEQFYQQAFALDPNNANVAGNYAIFLTQIRGRHEEAETLYKKTFELHPDNENNAGNYAALLLGQGRTDEAANKIGLAKSLNHGQTNQLAAELAFYEGILARIRGDDDDATIEELHNVLVRGFKRARWSFEDVLKFAKGKMSDDDYDIYVALSEGILDETKVPDIDKLLAARAASIDTKAQQDIPVTASGNGRPPRKRRTPQRSKL